MKNTTISVKLAAMLALILSAFVVPVQAQQSEKALIEECLKEGNCECAQSFYNIYKKLAGRSNKDMERRINECQSQRIKELIIDYSPDKALEIYEQNKERGMTFSEDIEVNIRCLQAWLSGYFDNCIEETPRFNAGIAMPMPGIRTVNNVAEKRLKAIADFAKVHDKEIADIVVVGFRSPIGAAAYGDKITQIAAETIKTRLIELGVDEAKISAEGKGCSYSVSFPEGTPFNTFVAVYINSKDFKNSNSPKANMYKDQYVSSTEFLSFFLLHTMPSGNKRVGDGVADLKNGTIRWNDGCWYEGDFREGAINGHGTFHWPNGDTYTGDFLNGKKHGQGTYTWATGHYTGSFANDRMNGKGELWAVGIRYKGDFVDDKRSGLGTCCYRGYDTGDKWQNYEGEWKDGLRNGWFRIYIGSPFDAGESESDYWEEWNMGEPVFSE